MNPEVGCYYRTSLPWHTLNNKLTPILLQIPQHNILSLFQLKEGQQTAGSALGLPPPHPHSPNHLTHKKPQALVRQRYQQLDSKVPEKKISMTLSPDSRPNEKIMLVSSRSKIKRHLVDSIDYRGIQNALYQKSARVTRFDQFYQTLVNKQKWGRPTNRSVELGTIELPDRAMAAGSLEGVISQPKKPFRVNRGLFEPSSRKLDATLRRVRGGDW